MNNFTPHQPFRIGALAFILAAASSQAIPPFAEYYSEDHPAVPTFDSGSFYALVSGTGFQLVANSQVMVQPGETYPIPTLARFDESGNHLFSVFMDNNGGAFDQELTGDRDDPDKFFAGFLGDSGDARLAVYTGEPLAADYALSTPLVVSKSNAGLTFYPGKTASLVQDRGTAARVLVLDPAGTRVFENDYASPDLLGVEIQGLSFQTAKLEQVPDQSGYFLSIHWSQLDLSNPLDASYENRFLLLRLNNDGTIQWQRSFDLVSKSLLQDISSQTSDNSYLYRLADTEIDLGSGTQQIHTKLIKIASDGSLAFSKRINNVRLSSVVPTPTGVDLYLGGTMQNPATPTMSDVVFLRLNAGTGALVDEIVIDQGANESGTFAGATTNNVYGLVLSSDELGFANPTIELLRLDRSLGTPHAVEFTESADFASLVVKAENELLFSPFAGGAVGAFALDGGFGVIAPGCGFFGPTTLNHSDPNLTVSAVPLTLNTPVFTVTPQTSPLTTTTLPVTALDFQVVSCGTVPLPVVLSLTPGGQIKLDLPTESGVTYDVRFTTDLSQAFLSVGTVSGTGNSESFEAAPHPSGGGFYQVVADPVP